MRHHCRQGLYLGALILALGGSAEAQELAGNFDQLRVLVKPGDTLTITESSGQQLRGKLTQLSSSSLVLNVSGTLREMQESDVNTIEKRGPDSLKNGALIGLGVGSGLGALVFAAALTSDEAGFVAAASLLYAGIGVGIGAGIDALIEGPRVIYAGSKTQRTSVSIGPMVRGRRGGVMLAVRLNR